MNNNLLNLIFTLLITIYAFSQDFEPKHERIDFKKEIVDCWKVKIESPVSETRKGLRTFFKDRYGVRFKEGIFLSKDAVLKALDVTIPKIVVKRINLYLNIEEVGNGSSEISIYGNYGYSLFFNPKKLNDEFTATRSVLVDFLNYYVPIVYQAKITKAEGISEKKSNTYTTQQESIIKSIKSNEDRINKLSEDNASLKKKLKSFKEDNEQGKVQVDNRKREYLEIKAKLSKVKR